MLFSSCLAAFRGLLIDWSPVFQVSTGAEEKERNWNRGCSANICLEEDLDYTFAVDMRRSDERVDFKKFHFF